MYLRVSLLIGLLFVSKTFIGCIDSSTGSNSDEEGYQSDQQQSLVEIFGDSLHYYLSKTDSVQVECVSGACSEYEPDYSEDYLLTKSTLGSYISISNNKARIYRGISGGSSGNVSCSKSVLFNGIDGDSGVVVTRSDTLVAIKSVSLTTVTQSGDNCLNYEVNLKFYVNYIFQPDSLLLDVQLITEELGELSVGLSSDTIGHYPKDETVNWTPGQVQIKCIAPYDLEHEIFLKVDSIILGDTVTYIPYNNYLDIPHLSNDNLSAIKTHLVYTDLPEGVSGSRPLYGGIVIKRSKTAVNENSFQFGGYGGNMKLSAHASCRNSETSTELDGTSSFEVVIGENN